MQLPNEFVEYRSRVNQQLDQQLDKLSLQQDLQQALKHGVLLGGKRARPCLVYSVAEMLGVDLNLVDPLAVAIELIHAYSLIHDDLPAMDDDDLRRGKPTCHIVFGEAQAILAGDILQSLAFKVVSNASLSDSAKVAIIKILADAAFDMCNGQALDIAATGNKLNLEQLSSLHHQKTGALIKAAVLMPAYVNENITPKTITLLQQYADCIGLAFQVQDDILDVTADTETLGKPQGSDAAQNKSTYPEIMGLEAAQEKSAELLQQSLQALSALPYNTQPLAKFAEYIVKRTH